MSEAHDVPTQSAATLREPPAPAQTPHAHRMFTVSTWGGAFREFAVIVAGVLVALGAQAWWEGRQERRFEGDYLEQLLADTRENQTRLHAAIRLDSVSAWATGKAVAALDSDDASIPPDSVLNWIRNAGAASDFKPLTGTYQALVGTGDLRLLRTDSLRILVARHAATLESEALRLHQLRGQLLSTIGPFVHAVPFMRRAFSGGLSAADVDVAALQQNPAAAVQLFTLQASAMNRLSGLRGLLAETEQLERVLLAEPALEP